MHPKKYKGNVKWQNRKKLKISLGHTFLFLFSNSVEKMKIFVPLAFKIYLRELVVIFDRIQFETKIPLEVFITYILKLHKESLFQIMLVYKCMFKRTFANARISHSYKAISIIKLQNCKEL